MLGCARHALIVTGLLILFVSGCGGDAPRQQTTEGEPSATDRESISPAEPRTTDTERVAARDDGRKMIGDIPYDVWYDDPLTVYQTNSQSVPGATPAAPMAPDAPTADPVPMPMTDPPMSPSGGADWKTLISGEVISGEAKEIRNRLTQNMQSVGKYNGNYKTIQVDGAMLAALGIITSQHPDDVSWKDKADYVRDLGWKIEQSAQGLARENYEATQLPFEQFVTVMNGSTPTLEAEPLPDVPFPERVARAKVMQRMQTASDFLSKNVTTAEILKSQAEQIRHELSILAAMSKVISTPGYDSAGDEEYDRHARELIAASQQMRQAVEAENFAGFSSALSTVQKKCNECHTNYRFADDF